MKKFFLKCISLITITLLTACGNLLDSKTANKEPKYKISDKNVKTWVLERNKVEQCLYTRDSKNRALNGSDGQRVLYQMAVYSQTLNNVIGARNYQKLIQDPASQQYLATQLQKFSHTKPAKFTKEWCNAIKREYTSSMLLAKTSANTRARAANTKGNSKKRQLASVQKVAMQKETEKQTSAVQNGNIQNTDVEIAERDKQAPIQPKPLEISW